MIVSMPVLAAASAAGLALAGSGAAQQPPIKIALIASKTGPLEAYARQTEAGFMLGLEYATKQFLKRCGGL